MNLFLAFLHGEQALVGFCFAALIGLVGIPLSGYLFLRHTKLSVKIFALAYFIIAASACGGFALGAPDTAYIPILTVFFIAFIYTLPWNVITIVALHWFAGQNISDNEVAVVMLMGAGINATLLYFIAIKIRKRFTI